MAQAYSKRQSFPKWSQLLPCKWEANWGHMSSIWQAQVKVFESTAYTLLKIWYKQSCKHTETSYCKSPSVSTPFSTPEGPLKKKGPSFGCRTFQWCQPSWYVSPWLIKGEAGSKLFRPSEPPKLQALIHIQRCRRNVCFFWGGGWELWCFNLFWKGGLLTDKGFVLDGLFGGFSRMWMFLRLFFLIWFYLQREWIQK